MELHHSSITAADLQSAPALIPGYRAIVADGDFVNKTHVDDLPGHKSNSLWFDLRNGVCGDRRSIFLCFKNVSNGESVF